ncbi:MULTISPECIES: glycosyltransferase family 2 protein [Microbacterium]|uniref:glycosyltransferase family 2 protein n=1 Tax=Microbacterium TaxID=33882 RepID=UPI001E550146|nr:glycosyltransferase family 2 protein [Microbacterium nymphoidis]MCD2499666.1 glycosyltransferase family 2 protein [Microbacterium nymphoidis]
MTREVAIIVVNYASAGLLSQNLVATAAAMPYAHVYVVDNLHSAAERARVQDLADQQGWRLIALPDNRGFGAGVNAGAREAWRDGATDLLVLNPDASLDAAAAEALIAATAGDRRVLVSPVIRTPDGRIWFDGCDLYLGTGETRGRRARDRFPGAEREEWLAGTALWVTREVWDLVDGFDEEFELYWEDVDFSHRVRVAGGALAVVTSAVAVHDEGATHRSSAQRSEAKSELYYYFNIRNRLLYAARHLDEAGIRSWLASSTASARAILLRGGRRQFLRPLPPLRAAYRGLRDGRRIARAELARRAAQR